MVLDPRGGTRIYTLLPQSALARVGLALVGLVLLVLGFFFVLAVAAVLSVVAVGALARWWWLARKLAAPRGDGLIEGEYVIVERAAQVQLEEPAKRQAGTAISD